MVDAPTIILDPPACRTLEIMVKIPRNVRSLQFRTSGVRRGEEEEEEESKGSKEKAYSFE